MNKKPVVPWINLWMVVVGGAIVWLMHYVGKAYDIHDPMVVASGVFLVAVGILRAPAGIYFETEGTRRVPSLHDALLVYVGAWTRLRQWKWVTVPFAVFGVVGLVDAEISTIIFHRAGNHVFTLTRKLAGGFEPGIDTVYSLHSSVWSTLYSFTPTQVAFASYLIGAGIIVLMVLALTPLMMRTFRGLQATSLLGLRARFARKAAGWLALLSVLYLWSIVSMVVFEFTHLPRLSTASRDLVGGWVLQERSLQAAYVSLGLGFHLLLISGIVAGLVGSLRRAEEGSRVDSRSYLEDAARYLRPMLGFWLVLILLDLVGAVLSIAPAFDSKAVTRAMTDRGDLARSIFTFVRLLLFLVPFAIVLRGEGAIASVGMGLRTVFRNIVAVISFVAVGFSLILPPFTLISLVDRLPMFAKPGSLVPSLVYLVVRVPLYAFMLLAVWEFYRRTVSGGFGDTQ